MSKTSKISRASLNKKYRKAKTLEELIQLAEEESIIEKEKVQYMPSEKDIQEQIEKIKERKLQELKDNKNYHLSRIEPGNIKIIKISNIYNITKRLSVD